MEIIDAHQHFWKYNPVQHPWIDGSMQVLQNDFLPEHLSPVLAANHVSGCIAVQARETEEETHFLLKLAASHPIIKAVVGWVDPESPRLAQQLEKYSDAGPLRGFRPMLQNDPLRERMLLPSFLRGIGILEKQGYTCDLIILPDQLAYAAKLAREFPEMKFVIDHLAKPPIGKGERKDWEDQLIAFAALENVYCKISGMVTEADWSSWTAASFEPYMDTVLATFGTSRIMFGSDWPVCLLAADYNSVLAIVRDYFAGFTSTEQEQFFSLNAKTFYSF
ncbi:MAG: amidohydrolase [Chitinophagaceae bacterium]|nr:MAG: amidohydrolase [Chitinophagaceae bacterium]